MGGYFRSIRLKSLDIAVLVILTVVNDPGLVILMGNELVGKDFRSVRLKGLNSTVLVLLPVKSPRRCLINKCSALE